MRKILFILISLLMLQFVTAQQNLIPEKCAFSTPFICPDYLVEPGVIKIIMQNTGTRDLTLKNISFSGIAVKGECQNDTSKGLGEGILILAGQSVHVETACNLDLNELISRKKYFINVSYQYSDSNVVNYSYGELLVKAYGDEVEKKQAQHDLIEWIKFIASLVALLIIGNICIFFLLIPFFPGKLSIKEAFTRVWVGMVHGSILLIMAAYTFYILIIINNIAVILLIWLIILYLYIRFVLFKYLKKVEVYYAILVTIMYIAILLLYFQPLNEM